MQYRKHPEKLLGFILSSPIIYFQIIPLLLLDMSMELYHHICFPLFGLPLVQRSHYFRFDRSALKYLSFMDRVNCLYCSYANGLFAYLSKIAAETEGYWCGIKHKKYTDYVEPVHHKDFLEYGDEEGYKKFVKNSEP